MSGPGHGGRRKRGGHEEEHENHERWAVSYGDMMTVLCALFIVLYSMSQVDQVKYEQLAQSLSEGFNGGKPDVLSGSDGVLTGVTAGNPDVPKAEPVAPVDPAALPPTDLQLATEEVSRLQDVQAEIEARLAAVGMGQQVRYRIDERGLVIGLVANDVFFDSGSARLQPAADTILDAAAPVLVAIPDRISVEGHANNIPISGRYATNWELSSDRATQVLRHLVEVDGLPGERISAVGYGDTRPLDPGTSPEALATNRRVDLVIHSGMPETVRGLFPSVVDGTAVPPAATQAAATPTDPTDTAPAEPATASAGHDDDDEGH
ncbi:flagellar motor protein MotB [Cellulomonas sp. ATA003]|uniref:OmpA/MotB family protein n=1 Tax=Cellulomonas sp. ATA003 TaxID=3073064 RepID=UPI0028739C5D|nr:flagellar motor protein MotB [Cellulomonas sp. ATA003]WNB85234.1 flagellar motor protein MotB [Cellulomonas sp. ATA003]